MRRKALPGAPESGEPALKGQTSRRIPYPETPPPSAPGNRRQLKAARRW